MSPQEILHSFYQEMVKVEKWEGEKYQFILVKNGLWIKDKSKSLEGKVVVKLIIES